MIYKRGDTVVNLIIHFLKNPTYFQLLILITLSKFILKSWYFLRLWGNVSLTISHLH